MSMIISEVKIACFLLHLNQTSKNNIFGHSSSGKPQKWRLLLKFRILRRLKGLRFFNSSVLPLTIGTLHCQAIADLLRALLRANVDETARDKLEDTVDGNDGKCGACN